jgi:hypothetical protein
MFKALGLDAPAQYDRTQARVHELAARRVELQGRLSRFLGVGSGQMDHPQTPIDAADFGFSPTVNQGIAATFGDDHEQFQEAYAGLSVHIDRAGFDPQVLAERYPQDAGRMAQAYLESPEAIDRAENPLLEAAQLGGAEAFMADIFGAVEDAAGTKLLSLPDRIADPPSEDPPDEQVAA